MAELLTKLSSQRVLVLGNGGAGKTWLASRLGLRLDIPVVHLDDLHWEPGHSGVARDKTRRDADVLDIAKGDRWIMEGVYGQLADLVFGRLTAFLWIDLPESQCVANVRARGRQPGESKEQFEDLVSWVSAYRSRQKNWNSFETHQRLFDLYPGSKLRLTGRDEMLLLLESIGRLS